MPDLRQNYYNGKEMRISSSALYPGYDNYKRLSADGVIIVYLNDKEVNRCIAADEEAGTVIKIVTDAYGYPVIANRAVQIEELRGKVRIKVKSSQVIHEAVPSLTRKK
jgi:hypothetical protein